MHALASTAVAVAAAAVAVAFARPHIEAAAIDERSARAVPSLLHAGMPILQVVKLNTHGSSQPATSSSSSSSSRARDRLQLNADDTKPRKSSIGFAT